MTDVSTPYAAPLARVPTGQRSWALGFIAWVPIPMVSLIVTAIIMVAVRPSAMRTGQPVAMENARRAANWGLTVLASFAVMALFVLVIVLTWQGPREGFFPIGLPVIGFYLLAIAHAVMTIAGTVKAGRGQVLRIPLAIPFIRGDRSATA